MIAEIASGHRDLADILLLVAAIVFVLGAAAISSGRRDRDGHALYGVGLALVAVAWLVL